MKQRKICINIVLGLVLLFLGGCFGKVNRIVTNYYVLDYQANSERTDLKLPNSNGKIVAVMNSTVNRTYNRNQIVVKENFNRVRFLNNELWSNRLSDAVPNVVTQRLRAYNIFGNVTRDTGEQNPDFYLETNILNIEKVESGSPRAFLRMDFTLRDKDGDKVILTHRGDRYQALPDESVVYLVQVFNNMIMEETNVFASKCIMHFSGRTIRSKVPVVMDELSAPEIYYFEQMAEQSSHKVLGELLMKTMFSSANEMAFRYEGLDSLNTKISDDVADFNKSQAVNPGRYRITTGHNDDIQIMVEVHPNQRTVVEPRWCELRVQIFDLSKNRVRQIYDIWRKDEVDFGYQKYGTDFSVSDEEHGIEDKLWILPEGSYMVTLGGTSWSDLRDFATVCLKEGQNQTLTIIVDPSSSGYLMVGAGVLADELGLGTKQFHKGAIHANVNLSSSNEMDKNDPTMTFTLAGQFDNTIDFDARPFHYSMRSIYDLGGNISSDSDLRINLDSYYLKNVLLLYPWGKEKKFLNNLALYGRADLNTHFWDENQYFSENKNYILLDKNDKELSREHDQSYVRTKIALFPLRLKEGTGLTYRIAMTPNSWISLRGGYGWQQDLNHRSFSFRNTGLDSGTSYDYYKENLDKHAKGIETTLIFSAVNMLKFLSINSTFDALFPMNEEDSKPRMENENRINIRLYRNVSLDVKVNLIYDESIKPWLVYDYSTFLRLSLFY